MNSQVPKLHRILIIDDNPAIHEDFKKVFMESGPSENLVRQLESSIFGDTSKFKKRQNFQLESAFQGKEGLAKVQESIEREAPFSLAFVDVRMPPGWDGIETVERIWKVDPQLQIVICTAYSDYSWDDMRRRIGTSDNLIVLKKPFDNIEVIQLAHALTCKWELARETRSKLAVLDGAPNPPVQGSQTSLAAQNPAVRGGVGTQAQASGISSLACIQKLVRSSTSAAAIQMQSLDRLMDVNDAFLRLVGHTREEVLQGELSGKNLIPWQNPGTAERIQAQIKEQGAILDFPARVISQGNRGCDVMVSSETIQIGRESYVLFLIEEISDRIRQTSEIRSP